MHRVVVNQAMDQNLKNSISSVHTKFVKIKDFFKKKQIINMKNTDLATEQFIDIFLAKFDVFCNVCTFFLKICNF